MNQKHQSNLFILKMKIASVVIFCLMTTFSCQLRIDDDNLSPDGKSAIKVSVTNVLFNDELNVGFKSSNDALLKYNEIQEKEIKLPGGYRLVAELRTDILKMKSSTLNTLAPNIKYKVVVFKEDESYVTEKDYLHGQESSGTSLQLDADKNYIFIVYSINSKSELPSISFSDVDDKKLSNASIDFNGAEDLMYFRKDMAVTGNAPNYLAVILKHKLSQITTTIDAEATNYPITAVESYITPHNSKGTMALSNANIERTGTISNSNVIFATLNTSIAVSNPTIINANSNNNSSYHISALTIGPVTIPSAITPFDDLVITPGVKYNMKLTLIPDDIQLKHHNVDAVRINGQIWMRHNLGATYSLNPDQSPITAALHGNYYQWGRISPKANASTSAGKISGWDTNINLSTKLWNAGTEQEPVKSATDPCPDFYRIPTFEEMEILKNATVHTAIGTNSNTSNNYSAAKVLTSKKNANIKLTFPLAGNRNSVDGALLNRGTNGYYWSSSDVTPINTELQRYYHYNIGFNDSPPSKGTSLPRWGFTIKCIAQ